tara:strand:- start:120 stop:1079 length:960 start_codon:yes stop_codon:yes gene_type:complete
MPTVNATKYAIIGSTYGSSFTTARQTGNFATNQPSGYTSGVYMNRITGKAGTVYRISRFFMAFDLSAYSGQIITNLTLTFRSTTNTSSGGLEIKLLKHTAQGTGTTFSNATTSEFYSDVDFSTIYSTGIPFFSDANANNTQTLSSGAMTDASSGSLRVVIVQTDNDYLNSAPTSTTDDKGVLSTSSGVQSGYIPYLTFTATPAGWTDGDVNGVLNADIDDVNSVDKTDIKYVNNVQGGFPLILRNSASNPTVTELVYTNVNPAHNITNGDTVYENVEMTDFFDGGDDTWYWTDPNCSFGVAYANIDGDGELSNQYCIQP